MGKKEAKLYLFVNDIIFFIQNILRNSVKKKNLLGILNEFLEKLQNARLIHKNQLYVSIFLMNNLKIKLKDLYLNITKMNKICRHKFFKKFNICK